MPFLAPYIIAALVGGFASGIIQGIIKTLLSIGIGFVLYSGIDALFSSIASHIISNLNALPFGGILHILKVDTCVNILVSACGVKLILKGVTNGVVRKMEIRE